ncbi:MAG: DUF58 domain-containing protein [Candidatus Thiodiazotropha sp. (ex Myrtea spinifera)]|nr:DUF58 domain-containing protein [Candidatus Thiodiazotropha sp. (ex Myrtea spinifera)]MCU7828574.1 DUF58 domain-containing protein [Candidatus Thiodiazotropha sp. (ex Myrtea sp. 'scaly one' KF741663)]
MSSLLIPNWLYRFRRQARTDGRGGVVIRPRSLYILPTRQGILLALVLFLMLAGSINYGSNLAYLVTFLLGGIWLSAILHTWRNLLGLMIHPAQVSPVYAGQEARFSLSVTNPSSLRRFGISLRQKKLLGESADLAGEESCLLHLPIPTVHRGRLPLPEVSLHTVYPLGLFHAWSYARLDISCLVYPRPAEAGEPPSDSCYTSSEDGDRGVGADDFVGLRTYREGDSPRHIDWKAFARERGLMSKQFGGDRTERVELDWDLLPAVDTETRLSLLCRFILQAESQAISYGLHLPDLTIAPGMGERHKQRCLAALATFGE